MRLRCALRTLAMLTVAWCLLIPAGLAEDQVVPPAYPVPDYVQWLLETAQGELGYQEDQRGYTKYGEWAGDPYAEWCAEFVCWCVDQVDQQHGTQLLQSVYPLYSGQNTGRNWFIRQGRYIARSGFVDGWGSQWFIGQEASIASGEYVPQPGDLVFYSIDGVNTSHVAIVEYCTQDAQGAITAHVIEGNMPDRVQRNTHLLTDWRVMGYGTVYDLADIVMQSGNTGTKVQRLQDMLCYLGYLDAQYATGTYGPSTVEAVRLFQQATDKVPTGIANHHTQLTLQHMYEEAYWLDDANFTVLDE